MSKRVAIGSLLLGLSLCITPCLGEAATDDPEQHVWHLNSGLDGTPKAIEQSLNGSLTELWIRYVDIEQTRKSKQENVSQRVAADIHDVKGSKAYKDKLAEQTSAEAQLAIARANGDTQSAMAASSRCNLAKEKLKKLEAAAVGKDKELPPMRAFAAEYDVKSTDAYAAVEKTAKWRSKLLLATKAGFALTWPAKDGLPFLFDDAKVVSIGPRDTVVEVIACEYLKDKTVSNTAGDGIDTVHYRRHPVHITISTPEGLSARPGESFVRPQMYKVVGTSRFVSEPSINPPARDDADDDFGYRMKLRASEVNDSYNAVPDDGGLYGTLLEAHDEDR